jgi:hypothetical protein
VGLRAGLDRYEKSRPHRDSITGPSSPLPVATPTDLPCPLVSNGTEYIVGFLSRKRAPLLDDGEDDTTTTILIIIIIIVLLLTMTFLSFSSSRKAYSIT